MVAGNKDEDTVQADLRGPEYVIARAFDPLVSYAAAEGWDQAELLADLPLDERTIRSARARVPWEVYAEYARRFEERMGGPSQIHRLATVLVPAFKPMMNFIGFFASPALIFHVINRWAGPSTFPCVSQESFKREDGKLEVTLSLPAELVGCATFFRITAEMFRQAPCLVGGEPTAVDESIGSHKAKYVIDLPPSTTLWARVVRAFRAFFSGATILEELTAQHDRLLEGHHQLRRTHTELKRSEANFRSLIEQTPEGVLVLQDETIVYANAAMRRFLKVEATPIDRSVSSLLLNDDECEKLAVGLDNPSSHFELAFATQGDAAVGDVRGICVDWNGEESTVLVITDVTERNRVLDRAMHLDRMIAVGTLAAGMAHEISNPVAFIHSNLQYADEGLNELKDDVDVRTVRRLEAVTEALQESLTGTNRVREIVRDMKSFSRQPEETLGPVDLREVVRSAINMGWHEIRPRAKVRTEYDDVPAVLGNSGKLAQVILNLVVNAAQAMPDREREHNFIRIKTIADANRGVVIVEDNGTGMPTDVRRRIFEPFFTTKSVGEGTGMGLWISSNIVRNCGGSIDVDTESGRGTSFRIELPYAAGLEVDTEANLAAPRSEPRISHRPFSTPKPVRRAHPAISEPSRRIMVIDDEPAIGRTVERVFRGEEVLAFTDPHEAIKHLRDDPDFDVVVCDVSMSGMNGTDLYARIQAEYPDLVPKFLLVTSGLTANEAAGAEIAVRNKPSTMQEWRALVSLAEAAPAKA